mmetsp:Transcript_34588/g.82608  ORF Transcript_34588/g.82608 Transcript_34588/m.82608 type:complete len:215 (-) Transcript_34588:420-1064(-)
MTKKLRRQTMPLPRPFRSSQTREEPIFELRDYCDRDTSNTISVISKRIPNFTSILALLFLRRFRCIFSLATFDWSKRNSCTKTGTPGIYDIQHTCEDSAGSRSDPIRKVMTQMSRVFSVGENVPSSRKHGVDCGPSPRESLNQISYAQSGKRLLDPVVSFAKVQLPVNHIDHDHEKNHGHEFSKAGSNPLLVILGVEFRSAQRLQAERVSEQLK